MNTIEGLEISKADTQKEIEVLEFELKQIQESKIPEDIKSNFCKRLDTELSWLGGILEDEEHSIEHLKFKYDEQADNYFEDWEYTTELELNVSG